MKKTQLLQPPQPNHPLIVDRIINLLGEQVWRRIRPTFQVHNCYCCYDKGLLPTYLAEQIMIDYDISLCQLICPLCKEGKRLQNTWLAEVGYYYLISNREMVQALADKELEYWVNKIKETVNERLPD